MSSRHRPHLSSQHDLLMPGQQISSSREGHPLQPSTPSPLPAEGGLVTFQVVVRLEGVAGQTEAGLWAPAGPSSLAPGLRGPRTVFSLIPLGGAQCLMEESCPLNAGAAESTRGPLAVPRPIPPPPWDRGEADGTRVQCDAGKGCTHPHPQPERRSHVSRLSLFCLNGINAVF